MTDAAAALGIAVVAAVAMVMAVVRVAVCVLGERSHECHRHAFMTELEQQAGTGRRGHVPNRNQCTQQEARRHERQESAQH